MLKTLNSIWLNLFLKIILIVKNIVNIVVIFTIYSDQFIAKFIGILNYIPIIIAYYFN